jgi:hypothetical protein
MSVRKEKTRLITLSIPADVQKKGQEQSKKKFGKVNLSGYVAFLIMEEENKTHNQ